MSSFTAGRGQTKQAGVTIVELLISVALGLSVISSVLIGYLGTHTSSMNTLANSKLSHDLNTTMSLMIGEFRRAGYSANTDVLASPPANTFNIVDSTALEIYNSIATNTQQAATGSGSCIVYSYDMDLDGVVDAAELAGFRLNAGVVEMRTVGNSADPDTCISTGNTWDTLTDINFVTVTALVFDLAGSQCLNTREPDLADNNINGTVDEAAEANCYTNVPTAGSNDITVETRQIAVTLAGNLTNDSFVRQSLTQTVRVRNEWVRVR
jgi:prepilin peptidase dependent protein B